MDRIGVMLLRRSVLLFVAIAVGLLVQTGVASAASFTVTTPNDSNDGSCTASLCSLRDAVLAADAAGGASSISVPAGTYKITIAPASGDPDNGTQGNFEITGSAQVTIAGAGAGSTVIDANHLDRAFAVDKGAGLALSGMTIENGNPSSYSTGSEDGGGIYSDGGLSLSGVAMQNNSAYNGEYGGAIYTYYDQTVLSVTGSTFENNDAYYGGAIYLDTDTNEANVQQSITNSTFVNNSAPDGEGGAINFEYGNLTLSGDTFSANSANDGDGGAVYDDTDAGYTLTATNNTFDANSAYYGGGLYYYYGSLAASGNTFSRNSGEYGGAVYQSEDDATGATASVVNNTFDGNSAYDGGAWYNEYKYVPLSFRNNTVARNAAGGGGGGLAYPGYVGSGSVYANNIVAENSGGDCYAGGYPITAAMDPGNNLDSDGSCFGANGGDKTNTNPLLGPLADNGGPTATDALLSGSPAIDAGNDSQCPSTDQRGVPRPQGAHCDIGAFEAAASNLSVSNSAPANGVTNQPFTYTVNVTPSGPGPSSATVVADTLPAGETLWGVVSSQGYCSAAGSAVSCSLGTVNVGSTASVTLVVSEANAGSVTDTATVTNAQGANVSASATTKLIAPVAPAGGRAPKAKTLNTSHRKKHSAWLRGHVNNGAQRTWVFFQYGTSRKLGKITGLMRVNKNRNVALAIAHLLGGRKYFFRMVAINDSGISRGAIHSFRTRK